MSILIRGMEMPKNCRCCQFQSFEECGVDHHDVWEACYIGERDTSCPLVSVPPHGRLIDADELIREHRADNFDFAIYATYLVQNAPTVLEEEEE